MNPLVNAPMGPVIEWHGILIPYQSQHVAFSPGCSPRSMATTDARAASPESLPSLDGSDVGDDSHSDVGDDSYSDVGDDSVVQAASHVPRSEHSSSDSCSSDDGADFT